MSDERRVSPFEAIKHATDDGGEYWSARELSKVLGYAKWENFRTAIERAMKACETSGYQASDHFPEARKMIEAGKGARREVEDFLLSRYACYLVVQNGDPEKPVIAAGQTYFAVQTRRAELADELAGLSEAQRRLLLRDQVADENITLAAVAYDAGVLTGRDFAIFQNQRRGVQARSTHP